VDEAALKEAIKTLVDNGGSVLDTVHGGPPVRQLVGTIADELGIQNKIFWSTGLIVEGSPPPKPGTDGAPPKTDSAAVKAEIEKLFAMFKAPKIDLVQVLAHADIPTHLAVLREMKKEGRVRYIGVSSLVPPTPEHQATEFAKLESIMRNESIDFIGIDYGVDQRGVEQTILPLAQERKIGVIANFPFNRNRLFQRARAMPLPEWATEFDAKTWAQFFLKYAISHPAVTVARTGTSNAKHMLDNIGGGIGRLPDEPTRKRMAELVDSWPQAGRAGGGG
jgi:aryl-alcohol dehydrogenase-like predicted oxidoreductase